MQLPDLGSYLFMCACDCLSLSVEACQTKDTPADADALAIAGVCGCPSWSLGWGLLSHSCSRSSCVNGAVSYILTTNQTMMAFLKHQHHGSVAES